MQKTNWILTSTYYNYYNRSTVHWTLSRTTRVSRYEKSKTKTNLDLREQNGWMD